MYSNGIVSANKKSFNPSAYKSGPLSGGGLYGKSQCSHFNRIEKIPALWEKEM